MARVPLLTREDVHEDHRDMFDTFSSSRGQVTNIFRALMGSPKLFKTRYAYSNSLRQDTDISERHRELAILAVATIANSKYELAHHTRSALKKGITDRQISALPDFETSEEFSEQDRVVIRYAAEVTTNVHVRDDTWHALERFFTSKQLVELALIVAWCNQSVRLLIPLQIELEA